MITFEEWAVKFWNELNPASGKYWLVDEVVALSGTPKGTIEEWLKWSSRTNYEYVMANSQPMTDAQIVEKWKVEHPPVKLIVTPFGSFTRPVTAQPASKSVLDMTVAQLLEAIEQLRSQ